MNVVVSPSTNQATEVLGQCSQRLYVASEANKDRLIGLINSLPLGKGMKYFIFHSLSIPTNLIKTSACLGTVHGQKIKPQNKETKRKSMILAHLSHWLMVSYCDLWMSVVAEMILIWPSLILVQTVSVRCISRSHRLKIDFQDENFKNLLV